MPIMPMSSPGFSAILPIILIAPIIPMPRRASHCVSRLLKIPAIAAASSSALDPLTAPFFFPERYRGASLSISTSVW